MKSYQYITVQAIRELRRQTGIAPTSGDVARWLGIGTKAAYGRLKTLRDEGAISGGKRGWWA